MKEKKTNTLTLISYVPKEFLDNVLQSKLIRVKCYAYILHDKDVYLTDVLNDDGTIKHKKGDLKEPHFHIFLHLNNSRVPSEVLRWFQCQTIDGRDINTFCEAPYSAQSCLDYLIHKDNPEKFQYPLTDIVSYGFAKNEDGSLVALDVSDNSVDIIDAMLEGVSPYLLCKKYGREFIYHYKHYLDVLWSIQEYNKSILKKENSENENNENLQD